MTANDLKNGLAHGLGLLRDNLQDLVGRETRNLIFEFPRRPGALDLGSERRMAARLLKRSGQCRQVLAIGDCTIRVEGIAPRSISGMVDRAIELGACRCAVMG